MTNIEAELLDQLLEQEEDETKHKGYEAELSFYNLIMQGNVDVLKQTHFSLMDKGLGKLSNNFRQNLLYHYIVCTAMITRFCIEGGMNSETAYTLSDLYIQKVDKLKTPEEIMSLHRELCFDFAYRMKLICNDATYSSHISLCIEWINNNLQKPISITEISNHLHLNKSYLCTLFKKETGTTINTFVERRRIELAQNYLSFTEYSYVDISNNLCFSSHSHFIQAFKKQTGMTPGEYRKKHFRHHFKT